MNGPANENANLDPSKIQAVQVNSEVVQVLTDALDRARRGEIQGIAFTFVRADLLSGDAISVGNIPMAMILVGALEVAKTKIVNLAISTQQNVPASRVIRPAPGMRVG